MSGEATDGAGEGNTGRVEQLERKVGELTQTLAQAREALDSTERRHAIDLELIRQETVDLETARLLTEMAVADMAEKDVGAAVRELKKRKAFLFKPAAEAGARSVGAMGANARAQGGDSLPALASRAAETGDRAALLRYLKARRGR